MARLLTPPTSSLRKVLGDIKHHYVFHLNHQNLILWLQKYLHIGYILLIIPIYSYLTNMTITTIDLFYFDNNIKTQKHLNQASKSTDERESQLPYSIAQQGPRTLQLSLPTLFFPSSTTQSKFSSILLIPNSLNPQKAKVVRESQLQR